MGDIIVTSLSKHSRNRHVGEEIGKGRKLDEVIKEMNMVAEGVTTIKNAIMFKEEFGLELPLITKLHKVIFEGENVLTLIENV